MFTNHAARKGIESARGKLERTKDPGYLKFLIEEGESIPIPSAPKVITEDKKISKAAVAARTAYLRVVVQTAKQRMATLVAEGKKPKIEDLTLEVFELGMQLVEPYTRRGRESQQAATAKLLARPLTSGSVMRGASGTTLSLVTILKECKKEYTRLTGVVPGSGSMPNFLRHLASWCSASMFIYEAKEGTGVMPLFKPGKPKHGEEVLVRFANRNGGTTYVVGKFVEERLGDGKQTITITSFQSTMKWFNGDPQQTDYPVGFSLTKNGEAWQATSSAGLVGTLTVLGVLVPGETMPYSGRWLDAMAVPASELERAALMVAWWEMEVTKRKNQLLSAGADLATRLLINFREHDLTWMINFKLQRIMGAPQNRNPFLMVPIGEWQATAQALSDGGRMVALALMSVEEMSTDETPEADKSGIITIWEKAFPTSESISVWQKYRKDRKAEIKKARDEKKPIPDHDTSGLSEDDRAAVDNVLKIMDNLRKVDAPSAQVSVKFAMRGLNTFPSVAGYVSQQETGYLLSGPDYQEWARNKAIGADIDGDANRVAEKDYLNVVMGIQQDEEEQPIAWEDVASSSPA
uniref:Nucleoprotein n=1 Tax=Chatham eel tosovirus TaxID=3064101 RepID=A0AA49X5M1_9VIRU|nr:MAG: nucleoprotein [Chatham eel tosovirus]